MTKVLLTFLLLFVMAGISMELNAKENVPNLGKDVICATLAFNAGYEEKGRWYFDNRIEQHFNEHKKYIGQVVQVTHKLVSEMAVEFDEHPVQIYRDVFNDKCMAPFA